MTGVHPETIAVGGYSEMGRNMTGVRIDNDIIVLDMGLQLDRVQIHEEVEIDNMHSMERLIFRSNSSGCSTALWIRLLRRSIHQRVLYCMS